MKRFTVLAILLVTILSSAFAKVSHQIAGLSYQIQIVGVGPKGTSIPLFALKNGALSAGELAGKPLTPGHRNWSPFSALHVPDSYSDKMSSLVNAGPQGVVIQAFSVDGNQKQTLIYTIRLSDAVFTSFHQGARNTKDLFLFTFKAITWTWVSGGAPFTDTWSG